MIIRRRGLISVLCLVAEKMSWKIDEDNENVIFFKKIMISIQLR